MSDEHNMELEKKKQKEDWEQIIPGISDETMNSFIGSKERTAQSLNIPEIGGQPAGAPPAAQAPTVPPAQNQQAPAMGPPAGNVQQEQPVQKPQQSSKKDQEENMLRLRLELNELRDKVQDIDFIAEIEKARESILNEVAQELKVYRSELDELKDKKIPPRKFFDTGGAYKEHMYELATQLLDEVLPYLFNNIPDYSLIATQISKTFDDGTVENGMVAINVSIPSNGYKYDFKVDVPILNGIIQSPLYLQRGLKIIPLSQEAVETELDSVSFRKLNVEKPFEKPNIFNNIGDNIHRRPDNQKSYPLSNTDSQPVGLPPKSKWSPKREME